MDNTLTGDPEARDMLRRDIQFTFDAGDPWGSAMDWLFPIAELLTLVGEDVPAEWEFRPGAGRLSWVTWTEDGYTNERLWQLWTLREIDADALAYWGGVLHRYADILRAAARRPACQTCGTGWAGMRDVACRPICANRGARR